MFSLSLSPFLSASPWHLYEDLATFMASAEFPGGMSHLRDFRVKDVSLIKFITSSRKYKYDTISALLTEMPGQPFVLVGDSTEKDPEVYGMVCVCSLFSLSLSLSHSLIVYRQDCAAVSGEGSTHFHPKRGCELRILRSALRQCFPGLAHFGRCFL
jgi:Phosphatidate phosphatase APP1, catalytic domain